MKTSKHRLLRIHRQLATRLPDYFRMWRLPPLNRIGPEQFADLFKITPVATLGQIVNATIVLENIDIDIDKGILQNIDIDKILYRLGFGISNTPIPEPPVEQESQKSL